MTLPTNGTAARTQETGNQPLRAYCEQAFAAARSAGKSLVRLTIAAPTVPLLSLPDGSLLWSPPTGSQVVGTGRAETIVGSGIQRYDQIRRGAEALWATLYDCPQAKTSGEPPRLFGGLSFAPHNAEGPWSQFGQGLFWLPRMLYGKSGSRAWLSLSVPTSCFAQDAAEELYSEKHRLLQSRASQVRQAKIDRADHLDPREWETRIEAIRSAIASGQVRKIVAARFSQLHFRDGIELRPALERLADRYPDCYRYAFQQEDATFVGASPETLVDKRGLRVSTQALAGSIAANLENSGEALLGSTKDRLEQEMVVSAIAEALRPICKTLTYDDAPTPRKLRHLTHLCTPILGELSEAQHVLSIVKALHPTPAVGGLPVREAMDWIENTEAGRGWYAGPVGWFDAEGDGHFAVAIRCALFTGSKALVYAGAGIVLDSNPALEYLETGLKQRAILDALGISG